MTQTDNVPSMEQIRIWLAAQPCPECLIPTEAALQAIAAQAGMPCAS